MKVDIKSHLELFFKDISSLLVEVKKRTWFTVDKNRVEKELRELIEKYRFIDLKTNK